MKKTAHKLTVAQRKCKEDSEKKVRFQIEAEPGDRVYIDRLPRRVQRPESRTTDPLTGYSENFEESATKRSRKLILRTTSPYAVRSATKSTTTIEKDEIDIFVSLYPATKMPQEPTGAEFTPRLHNEMGQFELGMQRV